MRKYLTSAAALIGATFIAGTVLAADPMTSQAPGDATAPAATSTDANSGVTKSDIVGKAVVDPKGAHVGTVKDVRTDAQGTATDLVVSLGKKDVLIPASEVKIASNDTLQTTKSAKEIQHMPAASGDSSSTY